MNPSLWHRDIRLPKENYVGCRWHFVTICTDDRQKYLRSSPLVESLLSALRGECSSHQFLLRAYCFMPDHLHLLLQGNSLRADLLQLVEDFKHTTSRSFCEATGKRLWQVSFYDHILRKEDAPGNVASYIWLNPVRAGLVRKAGNYPHSGPVSQMREALGTARKLWSPPRPNHAQARAPLKS